MIIKFKKLHPLAKKPAYAHPGDVGMDMFALETYTLQPGERRIFNVGFALEFPAGYVALVQDKSSLPKLAGIQTMGGVFDAGFRGEYNAQLINLGHTAYTIETGQKIAQLLIIPVVIAELEEADELSETSRGTGGFGSTGKF